MLLSSDYLGLNSSSLIFFVNLSHLTSQYLNFPVCEMTELLKVLGHTESSVNAYFILLLLTTVGFVVVTLLIFSFIYLVAALGLRCSM